MENNIQTLCRICFEMGHFSINCYEINLRGNNISIDKMIKRFSDVELAGRHAPELICENCTHDLVQSYLFTEKILEADEKIFNLTHLQDPDQHEVLEEELHLSKDAAEEVFNEIIKVQDMEIQDMEVQVIEGQSMDGQSIEDKVYSEEEQEDFIEESPESNIVEEIYIDSEFSADELEEIIPPEEAALPLQTEPSENLSNNILSSYDSLEEESDEPRKKYQRRNKINKEVDKNGSFVITQFASSTAASRIQINGNSEDNDEVALSDVRIMNYETIEIKAGNMDDINQSHQSELPIDDSRVYLCQYCTRAFSSSAFLIAHVRKTHGCKFCASLFEKAKDLHNHIREAHSKFECVVCGKQFVSNSNMRNHLKTVHKVKVPPNVSLISYKKQSDIGEQS